MTTSAFSLSLTKLSPLSLCPTIAIAHCDDELHSGQLPIPRSTVRHGRRQARIQPYPRPTIQHVPGENRALSISIAANPGRRRLEHRGRRRRNRRPTPSLPAGWDDAASALKFSTLNCSRTSHFGFNYTGIRFENCIHSEPREAMNVGILQWNKFLNFLTSLGNLHYLSSPLMLGSRHDPERMIVWCAYIIHYVFIFLNKSIFILACTCATVACSLAIKQLISYNFCVFFPYGLHPRIQIWYICRKPWSSYFLHHHGYFSLPANKMFYPNNPPRCCLFASQTKPLELRMHKNQFMWRVYPK
jgi:hypothetical protein